VAAYFEDLQFIPVTPKEKCSTQLHCFISWEITGRKAHEYPARSNTFFENTSYYKLIAFGRKVFDGE